MKTRATLKNYFKKGAIPTESNFADLIDSVVVQDEDNLTAQPDDAFGIRATGSEENLINFYRAQDNEDKLTWQIKQKPDNKAGLSIGESGKNHLFIQEGTGNIGIGSSTANFTLNLPNQAHLSLGEHLYISGRDGTGSLSANAYYISATKKWVIPNKSGKSAFIALRSTGQIEMFATSANNSTSFRSMLLLDAAEKNVNFPTGKVGIGVDSPNYKLQVDGDIRGRNLSASDEIIGKSLTVSGEMKSGSLDVTGLIKSTGLDIRSTKDTSGLFVDSKTGNVGLRMSSAEYPLNLPNEDLFCLGEQFFIANRDTVGSISTNAYYVASKGKWIIPNKESKSAFIALRSASGQIEMYGTASNNSTEWKSMLKLDASAKSVYFPTGKVGIGVSSPTFKLEVDGDIGARNLVATGEIQGKIWHSKEFTWTGGDDPVQMDKSDDCVAFLTYVSGDFNGKGEVAKVYISNGYWYLSGSGSDKRNIKAKARCIGRPS